MNTRIAKIFTLAALLVALVAQTAYAGNTFKEDGYNFKQIQTVLIRDVDFSQVTLDNNITRKVLNASFYKKAQQRKLPLLKEESYLNKVSLHTGRDMGILAENDYAEYQKVYKENLPAYADAYATAKMTVYETGTRHHDAYTSWETKTEYSHVWDEDYGWTEIKEDVLVPVEHPAYDEPIFYVQAEFYVYDAKTGKEIFCRDDWDSPHGYDGTKAFEEMCDSFFKDFRKLLA